MKFGIMSFIAMVSILSGYRVDASEISCKYSFDGLTTSDSITVKLTIDENVYSHTCKFFQKEKGERGSSMYYYACASIQNTNVVTYLGVEVSEGNVWNAYKDAALVKADGELLAICKK